MNEDPNAQGGAGGSGYDKPKGEQNPAPNPPPSEEKGNTGETKPPDTADKSGKSADKPEQKPEASPSGYDVAAEDKPAAVEPEGEPDLQGVEDEHLKAYIKENKLSKAEAEAIAKYELSLKSAVEQEDQKYQETLKENEAKRRDTWVKELRDDKTFGGGDFKKGVERAEKVLDLLPNVKKRLTETKAMLPPWIMRDLDSLHDTLFSNNSSYGDGGPRKDDTQVERHPSDFYNKK